MKGLGFSKDGGGGGGGGAITLIKKALWRKFIFVEYLPAATFANMALC